MNLYLTDKNNKIHKKASTFCGKVLKGLEDKSKKCLRLPSLKAKLLQKNSNTLHINIKSLLIYVSYIYFFKMIKDY